MASTALGVQTVATRGVGKLGRALIFWYFIAIFTVFSLQIGDLRLTSFFALPAAIAMFVRNLSSINRREVTLLAVLLSVALLSVLAGVNADLIGERAKSFGLFCYTIFMAYAVRLELGRATRKDVSWISGWLVALILFAAVLEFLGPLKPISDAFRIWNSPLVYDAEKRDLSIAGFIRPSVFTAEPSYVATGLAAFAFAWFVSTRSPRRVVLLGLVTLITVYLVRSPISAIILPPVALILLAGAFRQSSGTRRLRQTYFAAVTVVLAVPVTYVAFAGIFDSRGGLAGDQSLAVRLIAPPRIAAMVFSESPFLGVGLGGRDALLVQMETVFNELGLYRAVDYSTNEMRLPNAFWEHWIYFGLLGGVVAAVAIFRYFRQLCPGNCAATALFLFLLANSLGAYTTPRIWSFATLVVMATALSNREEAGDRPVVRGGKPVPQMARLRGDFG